MRTLLMATFMVATVLFVAGCDDMYQSSAPVEVGPAVAERQAAPQRNAPEEFSAMATPAQGPGQQTTVAQSSGRISTTQQLPSGYVYINEKELTPVIRQ
ncbi:MAG: hypothetical protein LBJ46_00850 [Planctomycetota bacterium]|nr:hypothetical protein [Planctomycetota bacterium]